MKLEKTVASPLISLAHEQKKMKLIEIVADLASFDDKNTIYASKPWIADCEAIVVLGPESTLPVVVGRRQMNYFLEVFIARDFLDDWPASLETPPTLEAKCARLIH